MAGQHTPRRNPEHFGGEGAGSPAKIDRPAAWTASGGSEGADRRPGSAGPLQPPDVKAPVVGSASRQVAVVAEPVRCRPLTRMPLSKISRVRDHGARRRSPEAEGGWAVTAGGAGSMHLIAATASSWKLALPSVRADGPNGDGSRPRDARIRGRFGLNRARSDCRTKPRDAGLRGRSGLRRRRTGPSRRGRGRCPRRRRRGA